MLLVLALFLPQEPVQSLNSVSDTFMDLAEVLILFANLIYSHIYIDAFERSYEYFEWKALFKKLIQSPISF